MQPIKSKLSISVLLMVATILIGGLLVATNVTYAAPTAQESGDDTAANTIYLPSIMSASGSTTIVPLSPDTYASEGEEAPALSDEQAQSSTFCYSYISFSNSSSYTIKVYYDNGYGGETLYKTMSSQSAYWQQTYYGNTWKIRDSSGTLLKSFTANSCFYMYVTINNNDFPQPTATPTSSGGGACYTEIIATHSNKCMDVAGASYSNNAQVQQYSCSGGDNQKFFFSPVPGKADTYLIRAKHSGKAVDVLNGANSAGKDLVQYTADGSSSQQWKIVSVGGNIYELKNINSGLVADVSGASTSNGAHVIQWGDGNAANQRWKITSCLGQQPTSAIGDRVWDDANRNGVQDTGEAGISGVSVALWVDSDNNGSHDTLVATTTTDANGNYSFSGLDASKRYVVKFTLPYCYAFTTPNVGNDSTDSDVSNFVYDGTELITLTAGQTDNSVDAGMYNSCQPTPTNTPVPPTPTKTATPAPQLGSIGDRVWNDFNRNGIQEAGEPGVAGVTMQLKNCSGVVLQSQSTDGNGTYTFNNLSAACYMIGIVTPSGYQISPKAQGTDGNLDSDINIGNAMSDNINLGAGQNITNIDAGINQPVAPTPTNTPAPQLGSIGDRIWRDDNGNGQQDGGEPSVSGVTVQLKTCGGSVLQSTTTDGNGIYGFSGLAAGCYTIGVVLPSGYTFSPQNIGNDNTDSDINPGTAMSDNVNLGAGQNITSVDGGLVPQAQNNASLGDKIWRDDNGNGQQDAGEPGISGVTVQLKSCGGTVLQSTTTDGNGTYGFSGLAAGCYTIGVVLPSGYTFSPQNVGNDNTDSDINPGTAMSDNVNLAAGENNPTIDGGLVPQAQNNAAIGDKVFSDTNGNGQQDAGEPGVSGVTVQLKDCGGTVLQSTTTDGNGNYGFSGLAAGCYTIGVVLPSGYTFSPQNVGNDNTDSDINPGNAMSDNVNLAAGQTNNTVDAGLVPQSTGGDTCIGDYVWYDTNMNGLQDGGEMGISGADVYLGTDTNADGRIDRYFGNMQTDGNGAYLFCSLDPTIIYSVEFVPPMGCGFTLPNVGNNDAIDSDADLSKGVATGVVVVDGTTNDTIDAGFVCGAD